MGEKTVGRWAEVDRESVEGPRERDGASCRAALAAASLQGSLFGSCD